MIVPMIVPQPTRIALLEMVRPFMKVFVPPVMLNTAAETPSPTTNGLPFATVTFLALRMPAFNANVPAEFVSRRESVETGPPLSVRLPPATLMLPELAELATEMVPPVISTWPVEMELPTRKFDDRLRKPPATVRIPLAVFVRTAANLALAAWTVPLEMMIWPL